METTHSTLDPSPSRCLFLVDGNGFAYRAFHATPYLSNSKGLPTNAIFAFLNMIRKLINTEHPKALAVVFDSPVPSFRAQISEDYKAQRPPMPDNLVVQLPYIKELMRLMGIPTLEREGFEADDIIATIVTGLKNADAEICIVTSDKDMGQLVSDRVFLLDTQKNLKSGAREVAHKFGVAPEHMRDFLALAGDASDNIPGVPGIGDKTARELIQNLGTLEQIYDNLDRVKRPSVREKLAAGRELAFMSRQLSTLRHDVPLADIDAVLRPGDEDRQGLRTLLRELEFLSLYREIEPDDKKVQTFTEVGVWELNTERVAIVADFRGKNLSDKTLKGFAAFDGEHVAYSENPEDLGNLLNRVRSPTVHDLKPFFAFARNAGTTVPAGIFDTMLAAYLVNPLRKEYGLETLAEEYLDAHLPTGNEQETIRNKSLHLIQLQETFHKEMKDMGLIDLFSTIEMPLVEVLASMEIVGVRVDRTALAGLSRDFDQRLNAITKQIYGLCERPFNINSPQQLARVLFEDLKLPPSKKTKTGYSTDTDVLQTLSAVHELPGRILEYRTLAKLKNTYIDTLPLLINPNTGRIHTTYNQMVVATGRLSSSDPNLQNIPIRGEEGRKIREAFIPEDGFLLMSSDYSQIELRVLAHLSKDPLLADTFMRDDDIHRRVAQEVFGVAPEGVTQDMRRAAKVINFGIIYGMSGFGLAKELGVSQREAQQYIDDYFIKHEGVKAFMDGILEAARAKGFVMTLYGRIRSVPELNNRDVAVRQFGERIAMNMPIQGTAADIIKMAMVNIYRRIRKEGLASRLIMQIHDELVFEVFREEQEVVARLVREEMEGVVSLSVPLKVSLGVGENWALAHD
jgi:DNA polymerase I